MEETLLFPSPNWFLVSNLVVSKDGWIIYGGPRKSICVLEPFCHEDNVISGNQSYRAHVACKGHNDKIVSVDVSPEFPEKKNFLSGSADGSVKQWTLEKVNDNYKIRTTHSHDIHCNEKEEITGVGYSTKSLAITVGGYGNIVKWDLSSNVCKTYSKFLANFKPTCMTCSPHIALNVAVGTKQGVIFVLDLTGDGKIVYKVRGQDDEITNLSWCPQYEIQVNKTLKAFESRSAASSRLEAIRNEPDKDVLEQSGIIKNLPEDSFDESIVEEEDMFDIYKDHEANEFGHKKYVPEDILVKVKEEKSDEIDYLAECMKLKDDILKRKNEEEPSIASLVEAMDKTHVKSPNTVENSESQASGSQIVNKEKMRTESSVHIHKHLLATIGRFGGVRIWSKSGKMMASCAVTYNNKAPRNKSISWPTLLWYTPNTLLLVDGKSQLLECNPLQIDCKNKLEWRVVHALHKRGLYALATDAPRVQKAYDSPESPHYHESHDWSIYSTSQDRNIIRYSIKNKKKLAIHNTCGGFLYNVQFCPYDAGKMAISVGDGGVRVWHSATLPEDDTKLCPAKVQTYWQNVQGKVLTVAWHPTKENLLAFGTGESRVGLLDLGGKGEKAARVLHPALAGGVYSLCWGRAAQLYAAGGAQLVVYDARAPDLMPKQVDVVVEGQQLAVGAVAWSPLGLLVGSHAGALALLDPTTHETQAVGYFFSKMIYTIDWHPLQTSSSSEESPYKHLIAVCSADKNSKIVIVELKDKEDGSKELAAWKTLSGHKQCVLQVAWSPHQDELLLSTSSDNTVRVWDVRAGACVAACARHGAAPLGAAWLPLPRRPHAIVSGAADCCLRLWDYRHHPPTACEQLKHETSTKCKKEKKEKKQLQEETQKTRSDQQVATPLEAGGKASKKYILPIIHKQMNVCGADAVRKMVKTFVENETPGGDGDEANPLHNLDFVNIFGSINEVNQILDMEMAKLLEADLVEAWVTLSIFRGHIDYMIQFASQRDLLCPYLVSMAPCVSFKYWKDVTQLYIAQIDRQIAKGEGDKISASRNYGGAIYKKATMLLSIHDVKGAVAVLTEAKLFKEAYVLCRIRYMDSIATETLQQWAKHNYLSGNVRLAAICHIALGDLSEAATILAKLDDQETLGLAADLAKISGRTTFADHVEKKAQTALCRPEEESNEGLLGDLPSRIELLMKDVKGTNDETENGDHDVQNNVEKVKVGDDILNGDIKV